jgi:hypothetical protein
MQKLQALIHRVIGQWLMPNPVDVRKAYIKELQRRLKIVEAMIAELDAAIEKTKATLRGIS